MATKTAPQKGWKTLQSGSRAPFVVWKKKGETIHGKVTKLGTYKYKNKTHKMLEFVNIETGEVGALTDNYGLMPLIESAKIGTEFQVEFHGVKKLKGRQTLKEFTVQVRT